MNQKWAALYTKSHYITFAFVIVYVDAKLNMFFSSVKSVKSTAPEVPANARSRKD